LLPTTGSRTTENILVGFAVLALGVALAGAASVSRRKQV
jgi:LPXTG-motif cell wall-anchored protein